jgi:hypothetical protein
MRVTHPVLAVPQIPRRVRGDPATPEDAEDAYQRGLEILLRKAPTTRECELVPWLKTVVIRTIDPSADTAEQKRSAC